MAWRPWVGMNDDGSWSVYLEVTTNILANFTIMISPPAPVGSWTGGSTSEYVTTWGLQFHVLPCTTYPARAMVRDAELNVRVGYGSFDTPCSADVGSQPSAADPDADLVAPTTTSTMPSTSQPAGQSATTSTRPMSEQPPPSADDATIGDWLSAAPSSSDELRPFVDAGVDLEELAGHLPNEPGAVDDVVLCVTCLEITSGVAYLEGMDDDGTWTAYLEVTTNIPADIGIEVWSPSYGGFGQYDHELVTAWGATFPDLNPCETFSARGIAQDAEGNVRIGYGSFDTPCTALEGSPPAPRFPALNSSPRRPHRPRRRSTTWSRRRPVRRPQRSRQQTPTATV